jgi:hypothetical protein
MWEFYRKVQSRLQGVTVTVTPPYTDTDTDTDTDNELPNATEEEKYILSRVRKTLEESKLLSLFDYVKSLEYLRKLSLDYPEMNLREIIGENWSEWARGKLKKKSVIHSQWRNFVKKDFERGRNIKTNNLTFFSNISEEDGEQDEVARLKEYRRKQREAAARR